MRKFILHLYGFLTGVIFGLILIYTSEGIDRKEQPIEESTPICDELHFGYIKFSDNDSAYGMWHYSDGFEENSNNTYYWKGYNDRINSLAESLPNYSEIRSRYKVRFADTVFYEEYFSFQYIITRNDTKLHRIHRVTNYDIGKNFNKYLNDKLRYDINRAIIDDILPKANKYKKEE